MENSRERMQRVLHIAHMPTIRDRARALSDPDPASADIEMILIDRMREQYLVGVS